MQQSPSHFRSDEQNKYSWIYEHDPTYSNGGRMSYPYIRPFVFGTRVLDLGCGKGWLSRKLRSEGFQTTPMDWVNVYPDAVVADITQPLSLQEHDTAIAAHVMHCLPEENIPIFLSNMQSAHRQIFTVLDRPYRYAVEAGCSMTIKSQQEWAAYLSRWFEVIHISVMALPVPGHHIIVTENHESFQAL